MKKLSVLIVIFLMLSTFAVAKGGSSGGSIVRLPATASAVAEEAPPDCEVFKQARNRIKCRLTYGQQAVTIPEPCRVIENKQWCINYYKDVLPCYEIKGVAKDKCFKKLAGFQKNSLKEQAKIDNSKSLRNYMLFVLYDMEEMIEDAHSAGTVSLEDASTLIDDIVKLKILVITKAAKLEIKQGLAALKANWPTTVR